MHRRPHASFPYHLLACLLLGSAPAFAQDSTRALTMEDAIRTALAGNKNLRVAEISQREAAARYDETQAVFLPQVKVSYSAMITDNPLQAFAFQLQQASISAADFAPATLNHPGATPNFLTSLDVQQPLFNPDQLLQRKSARVEVDISRLNVQRTREALVLQVRQAYMQLQLSYEAVRVLVASLGTIDSLYRYTQDRVNEGLLSKSDALNIQVQVTTIQTKLAGAGSDVKNASEALNLLMGAPIGSSYTLQDSLKEAPLPASADSLVPATRADLAALEKAKDAARLNLRATKMSALPRLNAFGSWQFNDSRMLGFGANAYLAGIQLSWDIFRGNSVRNKAATQQQQLDRLQTTISDQRDQSTAALRKALRALDDAGYAIRQATAGVTGAAESFRILRDRFRQGLAGSTDVLLAQDRLQQQQLSHAQAVFAQQVAVAYIDYLTANTEIFPK